MSNLRDEDTSSSIIDTMAGNLLSQLKIDRSVMKISDLMDGSDEKAYWLARTPYERLRQVEILRRINYGHRASKRLQRILELAERTGS